MRIRHLVAAFAAAAVVLPASGTAQAAAAPATAAASPTAAITAAGPTTSIPPTRPAKPGLPTFAVTGTLTAVNAAARTLTLVTAGGLAGMAGATVTVRVAADARIMVGKVRASLAQVRVGHRVTISGVRQGKVFTATSVNAR
jgi:hypothetical protein